MCIIKMLVSFTERLVSTGPKEGKGERGFLYDKSDNNVSGIITPVLQSLSLPSKLL